MILLLALLIFGAVFVLHYLTMRRGFRNVSYSLRFSQDEATEGDTVILTETLCSRKLLPLPWVKVELTTDSALEFASEQSAVSEDTRFISSYFCLLPYRQIERSWRVKCTRRGIFTVSHAVIVISDLFSISELSRAFPDASAQMTVLPAARDSGGLSDKMQQITGDLIRQRALIPDRFAVCGIREYAEGDLFRDLCLSATVRFGTPMVWQYRETASQCSAILLNMETRETDRDAVSDKPLLENSIRLCAALFRAAAEKGLPLRFCANAEISGQPVDTGLQNTAGSLHALLHILAALPYQVSGRFSVLLHQIAQDQPVMIVTPVLTEAIVQYAAANPLAVVYTLKMPREREMLENITYVSPDFFTRKESSYEKEQ
ncbi:MAG: DUF58 domain-containing protein [Oscillospiraceae bacterium]|nr:DUF58 domain-containing protein [Oscillospiraceae bacterium]